jgi:hypothetical protein
MKIASNKGVQGTLHKVSGPLTPDVRHDNELKHEHYKQTVG